MSAPSLRYDSHCLLMAAERRAMPPLAPASSAQLRVRTRPGTGCQGAWMWVYQESQRTRWHS
jgi:hypothetical protein